jgi:hypothetical protein
MSDEALAVLQRAKDLEYLEAQSNLMITSSIRRSEKGKRLEFNFCLRLSNFKHETHRQRVHDSVIEFVLSYFRDLKIAAEWNATHKTFYLILNLSTVVMTLDQSRLLTENWSAQ